MVNIYHVLYISIMFQILNVPFVLNQIEYILFMTDKLKLTKAKI